MKAELWPPVLSIEWLDDPADPQHNMDLDTELGQAVARGERPPLIRLWRAGVRPGIGVSRKDVASPAGAQAMAELRAAGWDVVVRETGGTAVPQGEGVFHVSYLFPRPAHPATTDDYYRLLCYPLVDWLGTLGCQATIGSLPGSYCDGNYNVLVSGRKLVGTAQAWRGGLAGMKSSRPGYILAHACVVVDFDMQRAEELINHFYALAGNPYRVAAGTSITLREAVPERFSGLSAEAATCWCMERLAEYYRNVLADRVQ
jgi:octanoyl-[GcvH]:protein N-octanoyltransferase